LPRVKFALLVALAALIGLAGCGTDGKVKEANDYVKAINGAVRNFVSEAHKLEALGVDSSRKQAGAVLSKYSDGIDAFVSSLRKITPPARVKALHAKLTATAVRLGASLRKTRADIISGNAGRILDGQSEFKVAVQMFSQAMNATLTRINQVLKR